MAYNELFADRIRRSLHDKNALVTEEKKMFGGMAFMVHEKMCIGIHEEKLMARIDPDDMGKALARKSARLMDFTGAAHEGVFVRRTRRH